MCYNWVGFLALSKTSVFELILMQTHVILETSQLYIHVLPFLNETALQLTSLERGSPTIYVALSLNYIIVVFRDDKSKIVLIFAIYLSYLPAIRAI